MNFTKLFALGEREEIHDESKIHQTLRHSIKMPITTTKLSTNCAASCEESLQKAEILFKNAKKMVKVVASNELHLTLPRKRMSTYDTADFVKNLLIIK